LLEGVRVRKCVNQAREEFEEAVREIEGPDPQIVWSAHNMYFTVRKPSILPAPTQKTAI